ncbi:hypothetical protein MGSAQ_000891 [marine sediment metagenome]|uniref:Uncharacterized protein n=1 Tax=marine sediment metagenome TaxID=412755 RepID=A0A1B6NW62_9ZZZZ
MQIAITLFYLRKRFEIRHIFAKDSDRLAGSWLWRVVTDITLDTRKNNGFVLLSYC